MKFKDLKETFYTYHKLTYTIASKMLDTAPDENEIAKLTDQQFSVKETLDQSKRFFVLKVADLNKNLAEYFEKLNKTASVVITVRDIPRTVEYFEGTEKVTDHEVVLKINISNGKRALDNNYYLASQTIYGNKFSTEFDKAKTMSGEFYINVYEFMNSLLNPQHELSALKRSHPTIDEVFWSAIRTKLLEHATMDYKVTIEKLVKEKSLINKRLEEYTNPEKRKAVISKLKEDLRTKEAELNSIQQNLNNGDITLSEG